MQNNSAAKNMVRQLNKETLLKILDHSYDGIFATDKHGITIYANKACETHYGLKPEVIIGRDPWKLCLDEGCFPPAAPIALHDNARCTIEQLTPTGARVLITTTIVYDKKGNVELLVQNSRDVKQLEGTKKDLEQALEMLTRIKAGGAEPGYLELKDLQIIANSTSMKQLLKVASRAAKVDSTILILGETGTGKTALAKYIHKVSPRQKGPFMSINCATLAADIIEAELFGYVGGAFTGALSKGKVGLLEMANKGTLFLDEIGELPLRLQGKILDVIQERRFIPVGGHEPRMLDCRIIAATNRDLHQMIAKGEFREDLYYRLSVVELETQPLRKRPEDIHSLIQFFLNKFNKKYKMEHDIADECKSRLSQYHWPGNIRELEHMIERLVIIVPDPIIQAHHLPKTLSDILTAEAVLPNADFFSNEENQGFDDIISGIERKLVQTAYIKHNTTRKLAQALQITQTRAQRLIEKYCK